MLHIAICYIKYRINQIEFCISNGIHHTTCVTYSRHEKYDTGNFVTDDPDIDDSSVMRFWFCTCAICFLSLYHVMKFLIPPHMFILYIRQYDPNVYACIYIGLNLTLLYNGKYLYVMLCICINIITSMLYYLLHLMQTTEKQEENLWYMYSIKWCLEYFNNGPHFFFACTFYFFLNIFHYCCCSRCCLLLTAFYLWSF